MRASGIAKPIEIFLLAENGAVAGMIVNICSSAAFADCAIWPQLVVMTTPRFDLCTGVVKVHEPLLVQAFEPALSVVVFDLPIGLGLSQTVEVDKHVIRNLEGRGTGRTPLGHLDGDVSYYYIPTS